MQCNATKAHSWTYVARSWRKFHKAKILRHYQSTQFHFTTIGAIISAVVPGTPAAKAGLKPGDVVMSVDGQNIDDPQQLPEAVQKVGPGKEIGLKDTKRRSRPDSRKLPATFSSRSAGGGSRPRSFQKCARPGPGAAPGSNIRWSACKNAFRNSNASSTSSLPTNQLSTARPATMAAGYQSQTGFDLLCVVLIRF